MKVGILGTGFGAYHAELYSKRKEVDELFLFGRNPDKLGEVKNKLDGTGCRPVVHITDRLEEILDNKEIKLVDICLPSILHKEYAVKAMEKGKDVFIETPVALELKDAEAIREAAETFGRKAFVDLFVRFMGPYAYLQELCRKETYGSLKTIRIQRKTPPFWGDLGPKKIVTDLMIHDIDFLTWLLGKPGQINACGTESKEGQCAVTALMKYGDTMAELVGSSMMPMSYPFAVSYEAVFEEAAVRFYEDGYRDSSERSLQLFTRNGKEDVVLGPGNCYEHTIIHVINCIRHGIVPINGIDAAVESLDVSLKIKKQITT